MSVLSPQKDTIQEEQPQGNWFMLQIRKKEWSPYAAGAMLGITVALSLLLAGQMPGSSGSFENLIAFLGTKIDANNIYFRYIMPAGKLVRGLPAAAPAGWRFLAASN
ncbi:MAG: hypothetical protein P8183_14245 [Anaerolineae bacterium]